MFSLFKKKSSEPKDARFMIDKGPDCYALLQKIDGRWISRGAFQTLDLAKEQMKEMRHYPKYFT